MASEAATNSSEIFDSGEVFDLCDSSTNEDELFAKIREWLNSNKDNDNRLQAALTYQNEDDNTPLHYIFLYKAPFDIIQTLINCAPIALKMRGQFGYLPIHCACSCGAPLEIVKALLCSYPESIKCTNDDGSLPLHEACREETISLEVVTLLIESYPQGIKIRDKGGCLPLHLACSFNASLELVTFLIESYPQGIKVSDEDGCLPLHLACRSDNLSLEIVNLLIESYPDSVKITEDAGQLPLGYDPTERYEFFNLCGGSEKVDFDRVREWLNNNKDNNARLQAALTYENEYNQTPLHCILLHDPPLDIIQALIEYAPETLQMKTHFGQLPFHLACGYGASLEVVKALLYSFPESITVEDEEGRLPLHEACRGGESSLGILTFLFESHPKGIKVKDTSGCLPLHLLWHDPFFLRQNSYSLEVVTFLVESYPESVQQNDEDNNLPLHYACQRKAPLEVINFLIESHPEEIEYYEDELQLHENPFVWEYARSTDNNGMLPLHYACKNENYLRLIHFLIQAEPESSSVPDNNGKAPLQYLKETASGQDERGMTLLHRQAANFKGLNMEILDILVHANPEAARQHDDSGLLPIHYACLNEASTLDIILSLVKLYPESILL